MNGMESRDLTGHLLLQISGFEPGIFWCRLHYIYAGCSFAGAPRSGTGVDIALPRITPVVLGTVVIDNGGIAILETTDAPQGVETAGAMTVCTSADAITMLQAMLSSLTGYTTDDFWSVAAHFRTGLGLWAS